MADGKPPTPPLPPHEEGEIPNSTVYLSKPKLHSIMSRLSSVSNKESSTPLPPPPQDEVEKSEHNLLLHNQATSSGHPMPSCQPRSPVSNGNNYPTNMNQSQLVNPIRYADVVKGKDHSISFKEPAAPLMDITTLNSTFQGKPAILFPSMAKNMLVKRCKFVLVGKFSHGRPSLSSLNLFFIKLKLRGAINITNFDSKHIFLECSCKEDFYRIWLGLVWYVEGLAMRVFKWFPDFSAFKESSIAPVWISVAGLPLYMFEESALMSVAKAAGVPIKVDPRNINRSIVNNAWICVELDVNEPLVKDVWVCFVNENGTEHLDGFWIKMSYDVVPPFCSFCQHLGHTTEFCKRKLEQERPMVANGLLAGLDDNNQTKKDSAVVQQINGDSEYAKIIVAAGDIRLGAQKEGAAVVGPGEGELVGKKKDLRQLEGMLANKMLQSTPNATSSRISVNPKAQKPIHRQKKVYQAKKQPLLSSEVLEITKNSFAILEEEVLIEDLSLEEGELEVVDVCAAAAIGYHVKTPSSTHAVTAVNVTAVNVSEVGSVGNASAVTYDRAGNEASTGEPAALKSWPAAGKSGSTHGVVMSGKSEIGESAAGKRTSLLECPGVNVEKTSGNATAGLLMGEEPAAREYEEYVTAAETLKDAAADPDAAGTTPESSEPSAGELFPGVPGAADCLETVQIVTDVDEPAPGTRLDTKVVESAAGEHETSTDAAGQQSTGQRMRGNDGLIAEDENSGEPGSGGLLMGFSHAATSHSADGKLDVGELPAAGGHAVEEPNAALAGSKMMGKHLSSGAAEFTPKWEDGAVISAVAAREGCWADLVEQDHEQQLARPSKQQVEELTERINRLRGKEPDRRDVRLPEKDDYAKKEMKIGEAERVRKSTAQEEKQLARELKFVRERKNLKEYFMASAEKINSDLKRNRSEKKEKTTGTAFKYGEG